MAAESEEIVSLPDGIQIVASVGSLIGIGFGLGAAYARRELSSRSVEVALERVRVALEAVDIGAVRVMPPTTPVGSQVTLEFEISSTLSEPFDVWLGADIPYGSGEYFYDVTQDKVVSVEPGWQVYSRYFTIARPITPGLWTMNVGVWFGKKSDPARSIRLVGRTIDLTVT